MSYHPNFIPTGTLKGELIRVRKLCSNQPQFEKGVGEILDKAKRSKFPDKVINTAREMIADWDDEKRLTLLSGSVSAPTTEKSLTWVTQLPACIRKEFNEDLVDYLPENVKLRIAYQTPQSLRAILFNPKSLEAEEGGCTSCGHCKLCGKHGAGQSMVKVCTSFKTKVKHKFKNFKIKSKLDCNSSGIYVAICTQQNCHATYVGQTTTEFRTRISQHRYKWINGGEASLLNRDDTSQWPNTV